MRSLLLYMTSGYSKLPIIDAGPLVRRAAIAWTPLLRLRVPAASRASSTDDRDDRWDKECVHDFSGTYGDYLLSKVSRVFPQLRREVL